MVELINKVRSSISNYRILPAISCFRRKSALNWAYRLSWFGLGNLGLRSMYIAGTTASIMGEVVPSNQGTIRCYQVPKL